MKALILAGSVIATLLIVSTSAAAETQEPGWWTPAWVQAFGSVGAVLLAILVGWWQFSQSHGLARAQRESEDQERKLKARSLALALYPELLEMKAKIQGARQPDGTVIIKTLDIPPELIQSVDRLYLLGDAGEVIQGFVAVSRQYVRMVEDASVDLRLSLTDRKNVLEAHLKIMEKQLGDALERIEPIHDGKS